MDQQQPFYEALLVEEATHYLTQKGGKCINEYEIKETIGQGSFGKVKRATRRYVESEGGEIQFADYALKIFNRSVLQHQRTCFYEDNGKTPKMTNMLEFAYREINIWKYLDHPNVCKLYQIIDDPDDPKDQIYIVLELGDLGSIMKYSEDTFIRNPKVIQYIQKVFDIQTLEAVAAKIFKQVAKAIQYLYSQNIVNRDIKVDNIVCCTIYDREECIKLVDFSTARDVANSNSILYDCAGTMGFRSPEQQFAMEEGYLAFPCDIWSFGISLFTYLNEKMPFWADSELEIDLMARKQPIEFRQENTMEVRELINQCCNKDPSSRPNINDILQSKWLNQ